MHQTEIDPQSPHFHRADPANMGYSMGVLPFLTTVLWPSHPPLSLKNLEPSCHKPNFFEPLFNVVSPVRKLMKNVEGCQGDATSLHRHMDT